MSLVGYGDIHTPQNEIHTEAYWLTLRASAPEEFERMGQNLASGLHGLANLLRNTVPLYVLCDPRDFNAWPMLQSPFDQRPTLYVYDRYRGGIGIARRLYAIDNQVFQAALEITQQCPCATVAQVALARKSIRANPPRKSHGIFFAR